MSEYRICENKYGYFKIQMKVVYRIFSIVLYSKWIDCCYKQCCYKQYCYKQYCYNTKKDAQYQLDNMIKTDKKRNNDWTCDENKRRS